MSLSTRLLRAGLILAFLAMQGLAVAHDVDHALGQHDQPCALQVLANHSPGATSAPPVLFIPPSASIALRVRPAATPTVAVALPFSARAPPARS